MSCVNRDNNDPDREPDCLNFHAESATMGEGGQEDRCTEAAQEEQLRKQLKERMSLMQTEMDKLQMLEMADMLLTGAPAAVVTIHDAEDGQDMHTETVDQNIQRAITEAALGEGDGYLALPYKIGLSEAAELSRALSSGNICDLDLRDSVLSQEAFAAVCSGIAQSSSISALNLTNNHCVKDQGATSLGKALSESSSLATLSVSNCLITAPGAGELMKGASKSLSLTHLDMSYNHIAGDGAAAVGRALAVSRLKRGFGDTSLRFLSLSHCRLTSHDLTHFCRGLARSNLQVVDLSHNSYIADAGAQVLQDALAQNLSLRRISLQGCGIGKEGKTAIGAALRGRTPSTANALALHGIHLKSVFRELLLPEAVDKAEWRNARILRYWNVHLPRCLVRREGRGAEGRGAEGREKD